MSQKFIARERFEFPNGAIGYRPGGPFDCLGPYAKVAAVETIEHADSVEREDANQSGESGSILIEMEDGRKFRVSYARA